MVRSTVCGGRVSHNRLPYSGTLRLKILENVNVPWEIPPDPVLEAVWLVALTAVVSLRHSSMKSIHNGW